LICTYIPESLKINVLTRKFAQDPPISYPETVPQSGPSKGQYQSRDVDFWTSGFFPGSIYSLLERAIKYPQSLNTNEAIELSSLQQQLRQVGSSWSEPLHNQAQRTDTHDLGFMIMPSMRPRWEMFHDTGALETIITAAESLYRRFDSRVQAIRSWDDLDWLTDVSITSMTDDFLVIIDSMCNMDLLFYAAAQSGNKNLADAAVKHSRTLLKSHLRVEMATREGYSGTLYSTAHLVNFFPETGVIKGTHTAQGYDKDSTWSRGQAWAILGYAQAYHWSGHAEFLDAACGLAEYFLLRLDNAPECVEIEVQGVKDRVCGRYVPLWDFDAPIENPRYPLRDSSAGVVAANGMLVLSQALNGQGNYISARRYLEAALMIVQDALDFALAKEKTYMAVAKDGALEVLDSEPGERFDSILKNATVCNNPACFGKSRTWDHGLVYGDYYLIEFGTRLLRLGII
jgi:hypothetical protein